MKGADSGRKTVEPSQRGLVRVRPARRVGAGWHRAGVALVPPGRPAGLASRLALPVADCVVSLAFFEPWIPYL